MRFRVGRATESVARQMLRIHNLRFLEITPHFALRYTTQFFRHDITLHQTLYYTLSAILDTSHYTTHFFTPHLTLRDTLHYTSHYISTSYGCIAWDAAILVQGVL